MNQSDTKAAVFFAKLLLCLLAVLSYGAYEVLSAESIALTIDVGCPCDLCVGES